MTKREFLDYLNSFGKEPGEYSEQELVEIGINYQSLLRAEKDWSELTKMLGLEKNGEQFRKWILQKRYNKGIVPKNPRVLSDEITDKLAEEDVSESLTKQKEELFRERQKLRDTYYAYRRGQRDDSRIERFNETLVAAIKAADSLPAVTIGKTNNTKPATEMVLGLSDLHIGPDFVNSYNEYNSDIAVKRVSKLTKEVINLCKENNVQRLNVLNLGDLVSGLIHCTIRLEQELDITQQIAYAAKIVSEMLNQLQAAAPEVTYRSVTDNHSRAVADKNESIEKENFNKIIDLLIETRLEGSNIKFIHDNIDDGIGKLTLLNGKTMLFMHGHQDRKSSVVQDMIGLTKEWVDYIFMAHYHNSAEHTFQGSKVYVNGSILGTDTYAYGRRLFGEPEQKALIFSENKVMDVTINLK